MNILSKMVAFACVGMLIAGCGSAPYRSGKGSDHLVMYRPVNVKPHRIVERDIVYVQEPVRERYVYVEPQPAYRVVSPNPGYGTVTSRPVYRYVPVTQYYYSTE